MLFGVCAALDTDEKILYAVEIDPIKQSEL